MASDVMRVRLHLRQVRVLAVVVDTAEELRVRVESTVRRPRCPHCGFKCHRVHDTREREVRDLEVSGRRTTLVWMRRRFVCGGCDSRWLEGHPEFDGRLTRRLAHRLVADAQVMTIRAVVRRHGVSWPSVNALVRAWSGLVAEHNDPNRRCQQLLDPMFTAKGQHCGLLHFPTCDRQTQTPAGPWRLSCRLRRFGQRFPGASTTTQRSKR